MDPSLESKNPGSLSKRLEELELLLSQIESPQVAKIRHLLETEIQRAEQDAAILREKSAKTQPQTESEVIPDAPDFAKQLAKVVSTKELEAPAPLPELTSEPEHAELESGKMDVMGENVSDVWDREEPKNAQRLESYDPCKDYAAIFDKPVVDKYSQVLRAAKLPNKSDDHDYSRMAIYRENFSFASGDRGALEVIVMTRSWQDENKIKIAVEIPWETGGGKSIYVKEITIYHKGQKHLWKNFEFSKDCIRILPWYDPTPGSLAAPVPEKDKKTIDQYNLPWLWNKLHESAVEDARKVSFLGRDVFGKHMRQGFVPGRPFDPKRLHEVREFKLGMRNVLACSDILYNETKGQLGKISPRLKPAMPTYSYAEKPKERRLTIESKTPDGLGVVRIIPQESLNDDKESYSESIVLEVDIKKADKTTTYSNVLSLYSKTDDVIQAEKFEAFKPKKERSYSGRFHLDVELVGFEKEASKAPQSALFENAIRLSGWRDKNAKMETSEMLNPMGVRKLPEEDAKVLEQVDLDFIFREINRATGGV